MAYNPDTIVSKPSTKESEECHERMFGKRLETWQKKSDSPIEKEPDNAQLDDC